MKGLKLLSKFSSSRNTLNGSTEKHMKKSELMARYNHFIESCRGINSIKVDKSCKTSSKLKGSPDMGFNKRNSCDQYMTKTEG